MRSHINSSSSDAIEIYFHSKCTVASFILGMGMTITAWFIFVALVLAPALVMIKLNRN